MRDRVRGQSYQIPRRKILAMGGAMAIRPFAARGQSGEKERRVGVLMNLAEGDAEAERRMAAFEKTLGTLGWSRGQNLRIDYRPGVGSSAASLQQRAAELLARDPDALLANAPPSVQALQRLTQTVPIVFAAVTDPVALGIVQSLAKPGSNATGFSPSEFGLSGKWLELLKEIAPGIKRVAVFEDPANPGAQPQFEAIKQASPQFGVEASTIRIGDPAQTEQEIESFARSPDGGLIVLRTSEDMAARALIIAAAARHRLPAVYPLRFCVTDGGLVSYGPDIVEEYRQAAGYVDRILRGARPADLPVQTAAKFELVFNLKTAKALGLALPPTLLATADEVIE